MELMSAISILFIIVGPLALFFPILVKKITDRLPFLFYLLLTTALLFMIPAFLLGQWSFLGLEYKNAFTEFIYERLAIFVVLFYICALTYIGLLFQKIWKIKEESYGVAFLGSIILTPILYFYIARWFLME